MTPRPGPFRSPGGEGGSTAPPARRKSNLRSASIGGVLRILLAGLVPVAAGITSGAPAQAFDFVHQGAFSDASGVTDDAPTGIVLSLSTSRVHEPFSSTGTTTTTHTVTATLTGGGTLEEETYVSVEVGGASARPAGGGVSVKDARSRNADYVLTFSGTNVHVCPRGSFPCSTQGTIYIPVGMASGTLTFELVVLGDILHQENDESLTFSGMSTGLDVTGTSLTITNAANIGAAITLGDPVSTGEIGEVTLTATLDNAVEGGFTVEVSTTDGSATAGEDYTALSGRTLTFAGTQNEQRTFTVQITPDMVAEGNETFTVGLSGAGGAPGQLVGVPVLVDVRDTTTVTITDNDTAAVTLGDVSVGEDVGMATVVATLDNAVQGGFTVEASTEGVTATAGSDYTEVTEHMLTFMGKAAETQSFQVPIEDDDVYGEADETFRVSLGNLGTTVMVTITDTALVTIADNDEPPPVTLSDVSVREDVGMAMVVATLNVAIAGALTVTVETVDGTATAGEDYTALPSMTTFMFPAGTLTGRTRTFQVPILPDTVFEGDEAFTVRISGAGGEGAAGLDISGMATVTITDDDSPPTGIELSLSTSRVNEPLSSTGTITTTHTVTATLTGGGTLAEETRVSVEVDATATGVRPGDLLPDADSKRNADYVLIFGGTSFYTCPGGPPYHCTTQGTIHIPARTASATLTFELVVLGDDRDERDESLTFSGEHFSGLPRTGLDVTPTYLTIVDAANIGAEITLADPDPVLEGGAVTLTATLNIAVQGGFTVAVSTTDGSATSGEDYTALSGHTLTFAGTPSEEQTFTVQILDDTVAEGAEMFTVGLSGLSGAPGPVDVSDTATVTITDDYDPPTGIGLSLSPGSVTEGSTGSTTTTQVTVTATLTGGGTRTVSTVVAVTVAGGTATAGATSDAGTDFGTVDGFDITIPVGMASATGVFDLEVVGDTQDEGNETVTVSGSADIGASEPATAMVDLMITDDDDPPTGIGLSLSPGSVTEGSTGSTTTTQVTVTATLTGGGTRTVSTVVAVTVAGGTATAGATSDAGTDFGAVDGFDITIPVGMASATGVFDLEVVGDTQDEGNETVTVSGSADIGASEPATAMVDLMIADDDDSPTGIGLSLSPGSVTEGSTGSTTTTQVTVTATLTGGGTRTVSTVVAVTVAGGTATAGATSDAGTDFGTVDGFDITIPVGMASATGVFDLEVVGDTQDEGNETVTVSGSADIGASEPATAMVDLMITDDDDPPTEIGLSLSPGSVTEGSTGSTTTTQVTVTATLTGGGTRTVSTVVAVTVAGGTATAGVTTDADTDFGTVDGFDITIPVGMASATGVFDLEVVGDTQDEGNETVTVSGSADIGASEPATAMVDLMITDDDDPPTGIGLSLSPGSVTEGSTGSTTTTQVTVTATLTGGGTRTVSTVVAVTVAGGTATAGVTSDAGTDFGTVDGFDITIPVGMASATGVFDLEVVGDTQDEGNETVTVSGTTTAPGLDVTSADLTITDDDDPPTGIGLSLSPGSVTEGSTGSTTTTQVTVTATLTGGGTRTVSTVVAVTVAGGTATAGVTTDADTDFGTVDGFDITIPVGMASSTMVFDLEVVGDTQDEGNETVTVSGTTTAPGLDVTSADLTITDDDAPPTGIGLSLSPGSVTEGSTGSTTTTQVTVTATLTGGGTRTVSTVVAVTVAGGTATAGATSDAGTDFGTVDGFDITIPVGMASATGVFDLEVVGDTQDEGNETVTVSGSADIGASEPATAMVDLMITDDDDPPTGIGLSLSPGSVTEGSTGSTTTTQVTVTATLTGGGTRTVSTVVAVTVAGGTATAGVTTDADTDFGTVDGFDITIPVGMASATGVFDLEVVGDTQDEGNETVTVSGSADIGASEPATAMVDLMITDDDDPPTEIGLSLSPGSVTEGSTGSTTTTQVTVTATLTGGGTRTVSTVVAVTVAGGTATAGVTTDADTDFGTVTDFTITIPVGMASGTHSFDLVVVGDTQDEENETLTFTGTTDLGGGSTSATADLTINDDDTAPAGIGLSLSPNPVTEGSGGSTTMTELTVTATLTGGGTRTVSTVVAVTVAGGTATAGATDDAATDVGTVDDFTITIPVGMASGTHSFDLVVVGDTQDEENETLTFTGTTDLGGGETTATADLTITDDDGAPTGIELSLSPNPVTEGSGGSTTMTELTVTATLTGGGTRTVSTVVAVTVAGGTATAGATDDAATDVGTVDDFTITIPVGMASGTHSFDLVVVGDTQDEENETLTFTGTTDLGGGETTATADLTITDDDGAPTGIELSLSPNPVTEGSGGSTTMTELTVTATLTGGGTRTEATMVAVSVTGGTATAGATGDAGTDVGPVTDFTITIQVGMASGTHSFDLVVVGDTQDEENETLTFTGTTDLGGGETTATADLTITDDDGAPTGIGLSLSPNPVTEGSTGSTTTTQVTVTATLTGGGTRTVSTVVAVTVAGGTATAGATGDAGTDVGPVTDFTITIPVGMASGTHTFDLVVVGDTQDEENETLTFTGTTDLGGGGTTATADLTITDDDGAPTGIGLSLSPNPVTEGSGGSTTMTELTVTATLTGGGTRTVSTVVAVTVADGTATAGATSDAGTDVGPVTDFTITIPVGMASGTHSFDLVVVGDTQDEENETLTFTGTTDLGGGPITVTEDLTITDDDGPPAGIELSLSPNPVAEGSGGSTTMTELTVTATLTGGGTRTVPTVVAVSVTGGTATPGETGDAGTDVGPVTDFTITIPVGMASGTHSFDLVVVGDTQDEENETLTFTGTTDLGGGESTATADLTITDDDTAPAGIGLSLSPGSVIEGSTGSTTTTQVTVTATLTGGGTRTVSTVVAVTVAGGTATAGATGDAGTDFGTVGGFDITIPVGMASSTMTFDLEVVGDTQDEGNETVTVSGTTTAPGLDVTSADLTITDDDGAPTGIGLSLSPGSVTEGSTGSTTTTQVTVTATLTGGGTRTVSTVVAVTVTGGTATAGATGDAGTDFGTVGGFDIAIPVGMASSTMVFDLEVVGDTQDEGNETVTVSGTTTAPGLDVTSADLTITDDDGAPTGIGLSLSPGSVTEGSTGSTTTTQVTVTATLTGGGTRTEETVVAVTVAGGTATAGATGDAGTDFGTVGGFDITIPVGMASSTMTFDLEVVGDTQDEGNETVTVSGTTTAPGLDVTSADLTITDDDGAPTGIGLSLSPGSVTEGSTGSTTTTQVTVTATLTGGGTRTEETVVAVTVAGGTATAGATGDAGTDFGTVGGFDITIPVGMASSTMTFDLEVVGDTQDEGNETVTVSGTTTAPGLDVTSADLTITDDDGAPTGIGLSLSPGSVTEGSTGSTTTTQVTVTATLTGGGTRTEETVVAVTVAGGTATAGATGDAGTDFGTVDGFDITIPVGMASSTMVFDLEVVGDTQDEGNETVTVSGTTTAPGLDVTSADLTITDDDGAPTGIGLSLSPGSVTEGSTGSTTTTQVTVTATLTGGGTRTAATVVAVTVAGGTATAGVTTDADTDFGTVDGFDITIPVGMASSTMTFDLEVVGDTQDEGNETVTVSGTTTVPGLDVTSADLTITDDDGPPTGIGLSLSPGSVTEGSTGSTTTTQVTVTATLTGGGTRTEETVVAVTVAGGTATAGATGDAGTDFGTVGGFDITIPVGMASSTMVFDLEVVGDTQDEENETVTVSGTTTAPGLDVPAPGLDVTSADLTITDDDGAPTGIGLSLSPGSVTEGSTGSTTTTQVTVTATLAGGGTRTVSTVVAVTVAGGTATAGATGDAGTDFGTVGGFDITIPLGMASSTMTFELEVVGDTQDEGNETVTVSGTTTAPGLDVTSADLTITDDDSAPTGIELSLSPNPVTEGDSGSTTTVEVTVTAAFIGGGTQAAATQVAVMVAGGTATAGDVSQAGTDFGTVNNFNIAILAGRTSGSGTFDLEVVGDTLVEGEETLMVVGTADLPVTAAVLTINDNDTPRTGIGQMAGATISKSALTVTEEGPGQTYTVVLDTQPAGEVEITIDPGSSTTAPITVLPALVLTFGTGTWETAQTVTVTATADDDAEGGTRTLSHTVSGYGDVATAAPVMVTVTDDDTTASTRIALYLDPATVAEDSGRTSITVMASLPEGAPPMATATEVEVRVMDGTAVGGADFAAVPEFTVTIAADTTSGMASFDLAVIHDAQVEGDETLVVAGEAVGYTVAPATLTIVDRSAVYAAVLESVGAELVRGVFASVSDVVAGRVNQLMADRLSASAGRLDSQASLARGLAASEQALNDGSLSWRKLLDGSFLEVQFGDGADTVSLSDSRQSEPAGFGLWATGDARFLSDDSGDFGAWDSDVFSTHVGADIPVGSDLVGMAVSSSRGSFNFERDEFDTDTRLLNYTLYYGMPVGDTGSVWAMAGYGTGELVTGQGGNRNAQDMKITMVAAGGRRNVAWEDGLALDFEGEVLAGRLIPEDADDGVDFATEINRLNFALDLGRRWVNDSGGSFVRSIKLEAQLDDRASGSGAAIEGRLGYASPASGLTSSLTGDFLLFNEEGIKGGGVSGSLLYRPGLQGRGLSFRADSSYSAGKKDLSRLWRDSGISIGDLSGAAVFELEIGYGLPVLVGYGVLTPYYGIEFAEEGARRHRLGNRVRISQALELEVEGAYLENVPGEHAERRLDLRLRMQW